MRLILFLLAVSVLGAENVSTFSIVAYDAAAGEWGVAVASRYFSVGSVVPWAEAEVGAIATQANVNVGYGPKGIELLKQGLTAKQVLDRLLAEDTFEGKDGRQVAIIDSKGNIAAFTGPNAPHWAGDRQGRNWSAQGNILVARRSLRRWAKLSKPHRANWPKNSGPRSRPATTPAAIPVASNRHPCSWYAKA